MDNLDQHIGEAKELHEPSAEFVPSTMQKVEAIGTPKKRWLSWKVLTPAVGAVGVVLVAVFMIMPHGNGPAANVATTGTTQTASSQSQVSASTPIDPTNTSDAALNSDLGSVNASLNQSSSDQSAADASINDNQKQISVPTE